MTIATILYWRDIPAQLIIGKGRDAKKYKLPDKYEKAIDRCAMKVGAKDSDSYLKDWRKATIILEDSNTDEYFSKLINDDKGDYTRYIYFYLS